MGRCAAFLTVFGVAFAAAGAGAQPPRKLTPAQMRQRQLECMRYNTVDPGQNILHLRCIVYGPSLGPPVAKAIPGDLVHPMQGSLIHPTSGSLVHPIGGEGPPPPPAGDGCRYGFVWREAFQGDHVCVTPPTRSHARLDNERAPNRFAGPGSDGCRYGFVWREAAPADHVCVRPEVRQQTWADNAAAGDRVAR